MQSSNPAISVIGKTAGYNFGGTAEQTATIQVRLSQSWVKLMSIAMRPVSLPPFPIEKIEEMTKMMGGKGWLK